MTWLTLFFAFTTLVFLVLSIVAVNRYNSAVQFAKEFRSCYRAARWLAAYNYAFYAAMNDVVAVSLNLSYRAIYELVAKRLAQQPYYGCIGQCIPIDRVPEVLHADALVYNGEVMRDQITEFFVKIVDKESLAEQTERQLRAAVFTMSRAETHGALVDIADSTGVPLPMVREVATALRSRAEHALTRVLGEVRELTNY